MLNEIKCSHPDTIKTIYLFEASDFVINDGVIIRKKRKYGKFKRIVRKIDYGKKEES